VITLLKYSSLATVGIGGDVAHFSQGQFWDSSKSSEKLVILSGGTTQCTPFPTAYPLGISSATQCLCHCYTVCVADTDRCRGEGCAHYTGSRRGWANDDSNADEEYTTGCTAWHQIWQWW